MFTNLYSFDGTHGEYPEGGLSLGFDGNFYGTTYQGGSAPAGVIFKITPSGTETVLYNFTNGNDGAYPKVAPVQAPDGNLYGVTGNGTQQILYELTAAGTFSVVATIPSQSYSPLIVGVDGNLYGMTRFGGTFNGGTAFQFSPKTKKLKVIHSFGGNSEGYSPFGPLMQGVDGKLYGTCSTGGTSSGGTVFQMTTAGHLVTLYNFSTSNPVNGATPFAGLVQGSDLFLYGVASVGGANGLGTLFKIDTAGKNLTVLHSFATATGDSPLATPLLHTNGTIYGVTYHGGSHTAYGTFYSFTNGLKPFVEQFVYYSGKVNDTVTVLGQGFSNATGVKFGTGAGSFVASTRQLHDRDGRCRSNNGKDYGARARWQSFNSAKLQNPSDNCEHQPDYGAGGNFGRDHRHELVTNFGCHVRRSESDDVHRKLRHPGDSGSSNGSENRQSGNNDQGWSREQCEDIHRDIAW